jgi:hypothetical protein
MEPSGFEEERKTKKDLEEVSYGRGTEMKKDVEGGKGVGCEQRSLEGNTISIITVIHEMFYL